LSIQNQEDFQTKVSNFPEDLLDGIIGQAVAEIQKIKKEVNSKKAMLPQTKQALQAQYNLDLEEFNLVLEPITDLELLETIKNLISKVKISSDPDADSLLETLISYREATMGSLKQQAYLSVNAYQQQVDQLISNLEAQKNKRQITLSELVATQDENQLNQAYQSIQADTEFYSQNQALIDNHWARVQSSLQITTQAEVSEVASELAQVLRTAITSDSLPEALISLQHQIQEYQTATEGEKQTLYQQHGSIIDQLLREIQTELTRRDKSHDDEHPEPPTPSPNSTLPPSGPKNLTL
jgi:hypothetical protein